MYLNKLSGEQKELFLDICIHVAQVDNVLAEEEKQYIKDYVAEMQLEKVRYLPNNSFEKAVSSIKQISTPTELRIIFFEVVALALADIKLVEKEQEVIDGLLESFSLDEEFKDRAIASLKSLTDLYAEINALIFV
ncbi:MAG: hypothetical protein P1P64_04810 [Treponemataceae bacterium]